MRPPGWRLAGVGGQLHGACCRLAAALSALGAALSLPTAAGARKVELIRFDRVSQAVTPPNADEQRGSLARTLWEAFDAQAPMGDAGSGFGAPRPGSRASDAMPPSALSRLCYATAYQPRPDLSLLIEARRSRFYPLVAQAACEAGVPVGLLDALVVQESGYNPQALSRSGAMGLTQLMPATAGDLSIPDAYRPLDNLRGGARYLKEQLNSFGSVQLALAAYNAGPARVARTRSIPRIPETRDYVTKVTRGWLLSVARSVMLLSANPAEQGRNVAQAVRAP